MKKYKKILTTLDMSELDDLMVDYTLKMAKYLDAKTIYGAHIIPVILIPNFIKLDPNNSFLPTAPAVEKIREKVFNEIKTKSGETDLSIHIKIEEGRPFAKLMKMVSDVKPDLLIFGKKEKSEGSGITSKRVAHNANADLLLVPQSADLDIQKILVPIDFSENSYRAIQVVQQLKEAMKLNGKIDLVHVLDASVVERYSSYQIYEELSTLLPKIADQQYQKFLNQYDLDESNFNLVFQMTEGENIANALLEFAEKENYQLIVMGAKGHSYFNNFVFGSVAETLIDLTHKLPIMIIR